MTLDALSPTGYLIEDQKFMGYSSLASQTLNADISSFTFPIFKFDISILLDLQAKYWKGGFCQQFANPVGVEHCVRGAIQLHK